MDMTIEDLRRLTAHQRFTNESIRNELFAKAMRNWAEGFKRHNRRHPVATELSRKLAWLDYTWSTAWVLQDLFPKGSQLWTANGLPAWVAECETLDSFEVRPHVVLMIPLSKGITREVKLSAREAIDMVHAKMLEPIPLH